MKRHMVETALIALVCVIALSVYGVASADNPALTASVECASGTVAIYVDGPGDTLTYTALQGPLAGITFRVTNGASNGHKWGFASDIGSGNTANSLDVQYRLDTPVATKTVLTPASCSAKQVTLAG